ncbi:MAG: CDP-glycerol glycerophosphotransferase family protein, partial [Coriobacteriaceae bacterium]|nr:CDP-glycerol glycerophosphotransferase family protein [Coriobacteriaceae bacterium]
HGVTALKQVESLFGTQGANPMTYFLTTSHREQEIVTEHLGYDEAHAPVLGFSRWDLLRNTGDVQAPVILVMPTWRPWLEELSSEAFRESRYFQAFSSLCANPRLEALLERANATVKFFIHPKLSEQLGAFAGGSPRVQFIDAGSMPLNELIMECAMLVTDYSSVCWDVLYLHKPVVFYQFDQDDYLREVGSYLDFDRELPGPVALDESDCVDAIASVAESGFHMDAASQQKAAPFQELDDTRNRERTYRFLTSHSL